RALAQARGGPRPHRGVQPGAVRRAVRPPARARLAAVGRRGGHLRADAARRARVQRLTANAASELTRPGKPHRLSGWSFLFRGDAAPEPPASPPTCPWLLAAAPRPPY